MLQLIYQSIMWSETELVGHPSVSHERNCFPGLVCYLPLYQTKGNNFVVNLQRDVTLLSPVLLFVGIWNSCKASESCCVWKRFHMLAIIFILF